MTRQPLGRRERPPPRRAKRRSRPSPGDGRTTSFRRIAHAAPASTAIAATTTIASARRLPEPLHDRGARPVLCWRGFATLPCSVERRPAVTCVQRCALYRHSAFETSCIDCGRLSGSFAVICCRASRCSTTPGTWPTRRCSRAPTPPPARRPPDRRGCRPPRRARDRRRARPGRPPPTGWPRPATTSCSSRRSGSRETRPAATGSRRGRCTSSTRWASTDRLTRLPPLRRPARRGPRHHPRAEVARAPRSTRTTATSCAAATSTRWSPSTP